MQLTLARNYIEIQREASERTFSMVNNSLLGVSYTLMLWFLGNSKLDCQTFLFEKIDFYHRNRTDPFWQTVEFISHKLVS